MIQQLQQFIIDCTSPDGSLSVWKDKVDVNTYHSNFAILGLARAMSTTGNTTASVYAWNWFRWFVSHQSNSTGYITDYTRASSAFAWSSTNDMDSTDSYAALFIMAVASVYAVDKNYTALNQIMPGVRNSVKAMQSTMQNGLTWAKPNYHIKYLMDQSEVYAGFKSCEYLAKVINDTSLANTCSSAASGMIELVNQYMWSTSNFNYNYGLGDSDVVTPSNWTILYPDAASQLWPAAFNFPLNKSTNALCSTFLKYHPNWKYPNAKDYLPTLMNVNYEMTPCGYALISCGLDVSDAVSSIWSAANASNLAYPFHCGTAGELILLATGGYSTPVYQNVGPTSSTPYVYKSSSKTISGSSSQHLSPTIIFYLLLFSTLSIFIA